MATVFVASATSSPTSTATTTTTTERTTVATRNIDGDHDHNQNTATATPSGDIINSGSIGSPDSVNNVTTYDDDSRVENSAGTIDDIYDTNNIESRRRRCQLEERQSKQKAQPMFTVESSSAKESAGGKIEEVISASSLFVAKNDHSEITENIVLSHITSETGVTFREGPLPRELRRIIQEVAKTGGCSWLSWSEETTVTSNRRDREATRFSTTANNCSSSHDLAATGSTCLTKTGVAVATTCSSPSQYSSSPLTIKNLSGHASNKRQSSFSGSGTSRRSMSALPPRKKYRNGVVRKGGERMRFSNPDGAFGRSNSSLSSSRKRPLGHVRITNSGSSIINGGGNNNSNNSISSNTVNATLFTGSATLGGLYSSAPSSVGSGRSTGSEPDYESTQYEYDSEGTSATTNSEISVRKITRAKRSGASNTPDAQINNGLDDAVTATRGEDEEDDETNSVDGNNAIPGSPYKNLQTSFRVALGLVLDHFYHNRKNGYKLSPAEQRRNERLAVTVDNKANSNNSTDKDSTTTTTTKGDKLSSLLSSEHIFQQRRQRLMAMLLPSTSHMEDSQQRRLRRERKRDDPPFTIQRIAEVLVAPDRYYMQTHKLCNCLEKLLLVNSSTNAFGGSTGGDTLQRRRQERELAALADEKRRQESKLRQCRLRKRNSSPIDDLVVEGINDPFFPTRSSEHAMEKDTTTRDSENISGSFSEKKHSEDEAMVANESSASPEQKRSGGVSSGSASREMLEALARASLRTKFDNVGIDPLPLNINERDNLTMAENRRMTNSPPPPNLNIAASGPNIPLPNHVRSINGYVRQHLSEQHDTDHNAVARTNSPVIFSSSDGTNLETATNLHMLQLHHAVSLSGVSLNRPNSSTLELMTFDASTISQIRSQSNAAGTGSESTDGRSSASNSDVDSESDDISFDDSASDRSDGSDSGSTTHHEPFTAARAMALNRMQQQQRLQSRVLTSLGSSHQSEVFRPPADSEYQSGDSIDSMRAEDSGGSDSSCDLAD